MNKLFLLFGSHRFSLYAVALVVASNVSAQTVAPPAEPFLLRMNVNAQWSFTSESTLKPLPSPNLVDPASQMPNVRTLTKVESTRQGKFFRRVREWSDGTKTEAWWQGSICLVKEPHVETVFVLAWRTMIVSDQTRELFSDEDFPELAWVGKDTFLEWTKLKGRDTALYGQKLGVVDQLAASMGQEMARSLKDRATNGTSGNQALSKRTSLEGYARLVWVDAATKLPVKLESEGKEWNYRYESTPPLTIELPKGFREAIGSFLEATNVQSTKVAP